jgi:hypothetical protein
VAAFYANTYSDTDTTSTYTNVRADTGTTVESVRGAYVTRLVPDRTSTTNDPDCTIQVVRRVYFNNTETIAAGEEEDLELGPPRDPLPSPEDPIEPVEIILTKPHISNRLIVKQARAPPHIRFIFLFTEL